MKKLSLNKSFVRHNPWFSKWIERVSCDSLCHSFPNHSPATSLSLEEVPKQKDERQKQHQWPWLVRVWAPWRFQVIKQPVKLGQHICQHCIEMETVTCSCPVVFCFMISGGLIKDFYWQPNCVLSNCRKRTKSTKCCDCSSPNQKQRTLKRNLEDPWTPSCWKIQDSKNQGKHPGGIDTVAAMLWRTPIFEAWPSKHVQWCAVQGRTDDSIWHLAHSILSHRHLRGPCWMVDFEGSIAEEEAKRDA